MIPDPAAATSTDPLLLAIDAGTGSCRAILFDPSGRQVALDQREYSHAEVPGVPGSQVFDTAGNWERICACVRQALASAGDAAGRVVAVSATSMREGMVLCSGKTSAAVRLLARRRGVVRAGMGRAVVAFIGNSRGGLAGAAVRRCRQSPRRLAPWPPRAGSLARASRAHPNG